MQTIIEEIFDEPDRRYLSGSEVAAVSQYVKSLPERLMAYRSLRDRETQLMQAVANQLEAEMPTTVTDVLEQSIRNGILVLRHCAMAMLMNDEQYLSDRLLDWLSASSQIHQTEASDAATYRLMQAHLSKVLNPNQVKLFRPFLALAQSGSSPSEPDDFAAELTVAAMF
jgi:Phycobilisome protein